MTFTANPKPFPPWGVVPKRPNVSNLFLLKEDGGYLLQENGDKILLDQSKTDWRLTPKT